MIISENLLKDQAQEYKTWFNEMWNGTTSHGNQELVACFEGHSLIRIKHMPCWSGGRSLPGHTEWFVVQDFAPIQGIGSVPQYLWKKNGRLLSIEKAQLKKTYGFDV